MLEARITREVGVLAASATQLQGNATASRSIGGQVAKASQMAGQAVNESSRTGLAIQAHPIAAFTAPAALAFSVSKPWTGGRYFVMNYLSY